MTEPMRFDPEGVLIEEGIETDRAARLLQRGYRLQEDNVTATTQRIPEPLNAAEATEILLRHDLDRANERIALLEGALRDIVDNDTDHFDYEGNLPAPPHDGVVPDYCSECHRIRQGWVATARLALGATETEPGEGETNA